MSSAHHLIKNVTDNNKLIIAFTNYAILKFFLRGHLHIKIVPNFKITELGVIRSRNYRGLYFFKKKINRQSELWF